MTHIIPGGSTDWLVFPILTVAVWLVSWWRGWWK